MPRIIVDTDTGEILNEINSGDKLSVVRRESIKRYVEYDQQMIPWGKGWKFVKLFTKHFKIANSGISGGAMMIMFAISQYISYGSNLLCAEDGEPLSNLGIQKITGMSEKPVAKYMNELVDKKVLFRGRTGYSYQYFANPYIYCKGNKINDTLQDMFKKYPVRLRKQALKVDNNMVEWGKGWWFIKIFLEHFNIEQCKLSGGAVAIMFAISQYVSYGSNMLCTGEGDNSEPLSNLGIQEITGVSKKTIGKYMDELVENKILYRLEHDKSYVYYANPYIYCRGNKITKDLKEMFKTYR